MKEVYERIYVGSMSDCISNKDEWVTVHACKHPCHLNAVGYRGNLPSNHPNYLTKETDYNLYLNIIDPPRPLFKMPLFTEFMKFTRTNWTFGKNVLIHCNQGDSRAPSLALLFLAKEIGSISDKSFVDAKNDFKILYPGYLPGRGIQFFLNEHWDEIK